MALPKDLNEIDIIEAAPIALRIYASEIYGDDAELFIDSDNQGLYDTNHDFDNPERVDDLPEYWDDVINSGVLCLLYTSPSPRDS